jgi:hypothetical protein
MKDKCVVLKQSFYENEKSFMVTFENAKNLFIRRVLNGPIDYGTYFKESLYINAKLSVLAKNGHPENGRGGHL